MIYKDIHDCPIKIYHRIIETGDVGLLEYESITEALAGKKEKLPINELEVIFSKMHDDVIDNFGVSEIYELFFYKQRTVLKLELMVLDGNESAKTDLEVHSRQLNNYKKRLDKANSGDIAKNNTRLRRVVENEYHRDMDKLSVFEFHTDVQDIQNKQTRKIDVPKLRKSG